MVLKTVKMNKRAPHVKYSQKVCDFICDQIKQGESLRSMCSKYPGKVPCREAIWDWRSKYPEFKAQFNDALQVFFFDKIDEIEYLSKKVVEEQEGVLCSSKAEAMSRRVYIDALRLRIDTLKFTLAKMASKFVKELQDTPQIAIAMPNINVISYKQIEPETIEPVEVKRLS